MSVQYWLNRADECEDRLHSVEALLSEGGPPELINARVGLRDAIRANLTQALRFAVEADDRRVRQ